MNTGTWITSAITATLVSSIFLIISYLYIYIAEQRRYIKYFLAAWTFYALRFAANLLRIYYPHMWFFYDLILICTAANSVFLYMGVRILLGKEMKRRNYLFLILLGVVIISVLPFSQYLFLRELIVFFFSGAIFIYTGISFLSERYRQTVLSRILGGIFILWGVHKWDYPFLNSSPTFAPFGYFIGMFCAFSTALGLIVLFSQADRYELEKVKDRLVALRNIPSNTETRELFDRVLHIAIDITESLYGFLYFYNEETEEFTLNTWSDDVYEDCTIIDPETRYDLKNTGYWGETVRQRRPIVENKYSPDNEFAKGIPEGHAELTRFCAVPFEYDGEICAVIGVANKRSYYTGNDVDQLELLMRDAWLLLKNKQYENDLIGARNAAQESEKIKSDFLANVSHELRTPLNGIIGMLGLLDEASLSDEDREYLQLASSSAEDLHNKIKDVLILSEVSSQRKLQPSVFVIEDILNGIIHKVTSSDKIRHSGIKVNMVNESGVGRIKTDRLYFTQICINIISNAFKFSSEGEIRIRIRKEDTLIIEISDQGCGIPRDQIAHVFDPFQQIENPYTKVHGGMGIGLTISSQLSRLLGFNLDVESEVGKGSTFRISIPLSAVEDLSMDQPAPQEEKKDKVIDGEFNKALIVEDEAINRLYLKTILSGAGLQLEEVRDGEEAIEMLSSESFDIVFLDIGLPKVNGIEVLRWLRSNDSTRTLPVIAVTAHSHTEDQRRILEAGADSVILKPFKQNDIAAVIHNFIKKKKSASPL